MPPELVKEHEPELATSTAEAARSLSGVDIDREWIRRAGLYALVRLAWPEVETGDFVDGWHIKLICDTLEQITSGEITRLIINIPPGTCKSLLVNVFWPAWEWIQNPKIKWMFASYHGDLVGRDARRCRKLVQSAWFQDRWGASGGRWDSGVSIDRSGESAEKALIYFTTAGGFRYSTTVGGGAVGWHAHRQVIDDPIKPEAAAAVSGAELARVNRWFGSTMASRKADPSDFARVIIMQRVHENDLSGYCIEKTRKGEENWTILCLPMHFDSNHPHVHPDDPRKPGELLWPEFKSASEVDEEGREMGPYVRSAQHQQHPSPPGGGVFKRAWFLKRWRELPSRMSYFIQSWDHTLGSIEDIASFVVGQLWGVFDAEYYLIDQVRARMTFPEMKAAMIDFTAKHPKAITKVFEKRATGPSLKQELDRTIHGIVLQAADATTGGKLQRAHSVSGLLEAGNVWIPHSSAAILYGRPHPCPWVMDFVERVVKFRGVKADVADEVDTMSQALIRLSGRGAGRFVLAMASARIDRLGNR